VIPRGTVLDENNDAHRVAIAFDAVRTPRKGAGMLRIVAVLGIYFTLFFLASTYLRRFGTARTRLLRVQLGLFSAMTGLVLLAKLPLLSTPLSEFWTPLAMVPLWVSLSYDRRTAFLLNVMLAFMASSLLLFDLPLLAVFITRGLSSSLFF